MSSKGAKTFIGVLLAAFSGAVVGLFILISLIFLMPTGASNSGAESTINRTINSAPVKNSSPINSATPSIISSPTPIPVEQTPGEVEETPQPTPRTTFTPITLPTPVPKPNKTPVVISPTPNSGKPPKTVPKPSPKKPIPTPSVHT
ncbi:MAG: hypothetical protein M3209_14300 [Acidobacteriota bacterium]|nr:hypothetical protein [Acidobacteriota bacterium]